MPDQTLKIKLREEQETGLITLYTKTIGCPYGIFQDQTSWQVVNKIEYDFSLLNVPMGTRLTVCLRARKLDDYVRSFLAEHPQGRVLHLGCGLDTRFFRVDNGEVDWYDLDLPDVIETRKLLFNQPERYHMIGVSVSDIDWMNRLPPSDQSVLVIAEGLMMYLDEASVKSLILNLKAAFPGSKIAFDAFSAYTAQRIHSHPSIKKTQAVIQWGIDDPHEIENWSPGIKLEEEWFFTQSDAIPNLPLAIRLTFKIVEWIPMAKKAQRILFYSL